MSSPNPKPAASIRSRLLVSAIIWCALTIGVAGFVLAGLFRDHVERQAITGLSNHLIQLIALAETSRTGEIRLRGQMVDPRYNRPASGWGWQIRRGDLVLLQSASLGPSGAQAAVLAAPAGAAGRFIDPLGSASIGLSRSVAPRFSSEQMIFAIARPQAEIEAAADRFRRLVIIVLVLLSAGQIGTAFFLMRTGLRPVEALRDKVSAMRRGDFESDSQAWPREIAPVVEELSSLGAHVDRLVTRARGQAADLAHAIKTPLTVLRQVAEDLPEEPSRLLTRQTDRIDAALSRHLARIRSRGRGTGLLSVASVVDDLRMALERAYQTRAISIETNLSPELEVRCDENDLFEIIGNPLDNAFKWARQRVELSAIVDGNQLEIQIDDDGPGVPDARVPDVLKRGARLDEAADGHGLGLAIAKDLAELYDGDLLIGRSELGGLLVLIRVRIA